MWLDEKLSDFCSSPFWDSNLTWNSPNPDFTECFEKTVLVWLPCSFLWLMLPWEVYQLRCTKAKSILFNRLNISKLVIISSLITITLMDTTINIFAGKNNSVVDISSSIIKVVTFILFYCLTYACIKCGVKSSGTHCLFSFTLAICSVPQFYSILKYFYARDMMVFDPGLTGSILYIVYFLLVAAIFILNFFFIDTKLVSENQAAEQTYSTYGNSKINTATLSLNEMIRNPNTHGKNVKKNICPELVSASLYSRLCFEWFTELAWKGYKKTLVDEDWWGLDHELETAQVTRRFESHWHSMLDRLKKTWLIELENKGIDDENRPLLRRNVTTRLKEASIARLFIRMFRLDFFYCTMLQVLCGILHVGSSQILNLILAFVQDENEVLWHGYLYAFLLAVYTVAKVLLIEYVFHTSQRMGLQMRTALMQTVYKKVLKISNGARREYTHGQIINLMSVDTDKFIQFGILISGGITVITEILLSVFFLWSILGPSVFAGITVLIVCLFLNGVIVSKIEQQRIKQMQCSDERVKLNNEALAGIRVIKLYACESTFKRRIIDIRNKEIELLKTSSYLEGTLSFIWMWIPFLVSFVTFGSYVFLSEQHVLDARVTFVSLSLLNIVKESAAAISNLTEATIQVRVATKRINEFLNAEELSTKAVLHEPREERILIENGVFSWDSESGQSVLSNINLSVKPGHLVAVVGHVGSGKSSLISAILGEMYVKSGSVNTTGSLAYIPQQAWIRNATLKNNITFGLGEIEKSLLYDEILEACALIPDLEILPRGDQTEIGEKGINLSGGQKQRVSLARAIYSEADTYLLDDPLSAVDTHVGRHIFNEVIGPNGLLKGKTRIFVTHNLAFLPQVDYMIILKNGMVSESGTYQELMEKGEDVLTCLTTNPEKCEEKQEDHVNDYLRTDEKSLEKNLKKVRKDNETEKSALQQAGSLTEKEGIELGSIKWSVIKFYLKASGLCSSVLMVSTIVSTQVFSVMSDVWLSAWSNGSKDTNSKDILKTQFYYLTIYALIGVGLAISVLTSKVISYKGMLEAAKHIHDNLLNAVFRWPSITFDRIPLGRIINRFGFDINLLDNSIPMSVQDTLFYTLSLIATLCVISYNTPLLTSLFLPIGIIYYLLQCIYAATSKQIKRLESVSKSPIYSHFSDTISGTHSVRAYGLQTLFIGASENKIDNNLIYSYMFQVGSRWIGLRIALLGNILLFFVALFSLLAKDTLNAGLIGLSLTYGFQILNILYWLVMKGTELENDIVAIERIKEYTEIEQEALWEIPNLDKLLPINWPDKGQITFENFQTRYREDLEVVLKGITFRVKGGERVGIVGRTGAGKSSLSISLFRLIESSGGSIFIDGVDISKLGLHTLRSRLTIIPQDPTLFSGTLRMNLDLTEKHLDEDIWKVLESTNMKTFVGTLNGGLRYKIEEGGSNLSVGQKQLICLARALLRKTKVLILDEATASVDVETDNFIQAVIREEFKDCTVLTIAHRLNTILDNDRIIVLHEGRIVEFDSPKTLLALKQSIFASMARDANVK